MTEIRMYHKAVKDGKRASSDVQIRVKELFVVVRQSCTSVTPTALAAAMLTWEEFCSRVSIISRDGYVASTKSCRLATTGRREELMIALLEECTKNPNHVFSEDDFAEVWDLARPWPLDTDIFEKGCQ